MRLVPLRMGTYTDFPGLAACKDCDTGSYAENEAGLYKLNAV